MTFYNNSITNLETDLGMESLMNNGQVWEIKRFLRSESEIESEFSVHVETQSLERTPSAKLDEKVWT